MSPGAERVVGSRVRHHRALAAGLDDHHAGARGQLGIDGEPRVNPGRLQRIPGVTPASVVAHPPGQHGSGTGRSQPGGHVRGRAATAEVDLRRRIAAARDRGIEPRDHVDHHVAHHQHARHGAAAAAAIRAASPALPITRRTLASRLAPAVSR